MLTMDDNDPGEIGSLLTNAILGSLERAPIRMRESGVTHAGWRMEISSDQGSGSIMLVELPDGRSVYRGEGMFLGWPREQLEATYDTMREVPDEPMFELNQLG
jgi:hypothetical protein